VIGTTSQQVSRARSNTARPLALFLALSVIEGLYFPKELLIFGFALSAYVLIACLFKRFNYVTEISFAFGLTDLLLLGMLFFSLLGVLHPIKVQAGLLEALRWGIYWLAYRLGVMISSNAREKQRLMHYIEGRNVVTIYNGQTPISFADPFSSRHRFRLQWGIPADAFVLGTIGRLHPTKGQTSLIKAAAQLHVKYPNLHLLLIGDGPLRQDLELELKRNPIPHTLTGYLPQAYAALPAMDLFVLPSVSEGMGLVLLEAMQAGVPIVASAVGGIPEVVRDGKDGLLVPPGNAAGFCAACSKIIDNPDLAKSLVISGQNRWPEFSIERMVSGIEQVYTRILNKISPVC
jgi:glycosyltransferase involved in cell wall biosynthesis